MLVSPHHPPSCSSSVLCGYNKLKTTHTITQNKRRCILESSNRPVYRHQSTVSCIYSTAVDGINGYLLVYIAGGDTTQGVHVIHAGFLGRATVVIPNHVHPRCNILDRVNHIFIRSKCCEAGAISCGHPLGPLSRRASTQHYSVFPND